MAALKDLPNIGKTRAGQLRAAGIDTPEQLREHGSLDAWRFIRALDPSAGDNRL